MFIDIGITVLLALLGIVAGTFDSNTKKGKRTGIISFILVLTVVSVGLNNNELNETRGLITQKDDTIDSLLQYQKTIKSNSEENIVKITELEDFTKMKTAEVESRDSAIIVLQQQLIKRDEELLEYSRENLSELTGGDSFCQVMIVPNSQAVAFICNGKYNLYDVNIRIIEKVMQSKTTQPKILTLDYLQTQKEYDQVFHYDIIRRNGGSYLRNWKVSKTDTLRYWITVTARNFTTYQEYNLFPVEDGQIFATRIYKEPLENPEVIFTLFGEGFPLDEDGKPIVDWQIKTVMEK